MINLGKSFKATKRVSIMKETFFSISLVVSDTFYPSNNLLRACQVQVSF